MSTSDRLQGLQRIDEQVEAGSKRLFYAVFGDRVGAAVFLAALLFFALYWRIEVLSTDNYMHMNTLLSVSDGGFAIDQFVYGPLDGDTPGVHYLDGQVYGDNYGLILSSLPALFVFRLLSVVTDLSVVLTGLWSLGVLGLTVAVRSTVDSESQHRRLTLVGATVALAAFLANVAVATPLSTYWLPLLALQSTSMFAAAFVAVVLYRFAAARYDQRVGVAAGVVTFLATPVGFWAVVPKRHSLTALFTVVAIYAFYRSRAAPTVHAETRFRAVTYAAIGLCTWVHAAEALILFVALVPVDLATARTNHPRHLSVVALAFALSLLPFALTNFAITGNPVQPLRLLPDYTGQPLAGDSVGSASPSPAESSGGSPSPSDTAGSASGESAASESSESSNIVGTALSGLVGVVGSLAAFVGDALTTVLDGLAYFYSRLTRSFHAVTDVERLADVVFRSGYRPLRTGQDRAVNLSLVESMPLLGVVLALPLAAAWRRRRLLTDGGSVSARRSASTRWSRPSLRSLSATQSTDVFVALYAAILVTFYLRSLPLHHMLTVRYLHPLYPLGVYALVRTPAVRRVIRQQWSTLWWTYTAAVFLGVPLYLGALAVLDTVQSEAIQLYALVALVVGVAVALWSVSSELVGDGRDDRLLRVGAVVLGVAAASMTVYLLVSGWVLFSVEGRFALPLSRAISDALVAINPFR